MLPLIAGLALLQTPSKVAVIPVLDLEKQHPRRAMMLTQLDRLMVKQLKEKGFNLISPDDVESAISADHIDFTHPGDRTEENLLRIGDATHADLVALAVITKVGTEFVTPDEDSDPDPKGRKSLKFIPWAEMHVWVSNQKARQPLITDKKVEGHCVWKFKLSNDEIARIAAAAAVGVEDELPTPK